VGLVKGFDPATAQGVIEACDRVVVTVQRRDLQQYQSQYVEIIGRALGKGKIEEDVYIPFGDTFGELISIRIFCVATSGLVSIFFLYLFKLKN
jgi:hypothetical protein